MIDMRKWQGLKRTRPPRTVQNPLIQLLGSCPSSILSFIWAMFFVEAVVPVVAGVIRNYNYRIPTVFGALFCIACFCFEGCGTYCLGHQYLVLESFLETHDPDEPWCERLAKGLAQLHFSTLWTWWRLPRSTILLWLVVVCARSLQGCKVIVHRCRYALRRNDRPKPPHGNDVEMANMSP